MLRSNATRFRIPDHGVTSPTQLVRDRFECHDHLGLGRHSLRLSLIEPIALGVGAHREVGGFDNSPGQILVAVLGQDGDYRKDRPCVRRYVAVRIRRRQDERFPDGSTVKHFAIVTNLKEGGLTLIRGIGRKPAPSNMLLMS